MEKTMTPDYEKDGIRLFNVDCGIFMAECRDKQYDLALTDPPYGIFGGGRKMQASIGLKKKLALGELGVQNMVKKLITGMSLQTKVILCN